MRMSPVPFSLAPRVVFDLRDWYRSTFTAPQVPEPPPSTRTTRSIVRVSGKALFLAAPTDPRDPNWPFAETVELVTQESAGGIRAFHGRVRTADGVLLRLAAASLAKKAKCRLTVQVRGFQPSVTDVFRLPGIDSTPADNDSLVNEITLFPAADYPFPSGPRPTSLLEGAVRRADGTGLAGATITPIDPRPAGTGVPLVAVTTAADGRFVVILDALLDAKGTTSFSAIDVELRHREWDLPKTHSFSYEANKAENGNFTPPRRGCLRTTLLSGRVLRDGRPIPGATVTLSSRDDPLLTGVARTNTFGDWELCGDARLPLKGNAIAEATLTVTTSGTSASLNFMVHFGERNHHLISLP